MKKAATTLFTLILLICCLPSNAQISVCNLDSEEVLCLQHVQDSVNSYQCYDNGQFSFSQTTVSIVNFGGQDYIIVFNEIFIVSDGVVSWTIFDCDGAIVEDCTYGLVNQSCGDYNSTLYNQIQIENESIVIYDCFDGPLPCGPMPLPCNLTEEEILCLPYVQDTVNTYNCYDNGEFDFSKSTVSIVNFGGQDYIIVFNEIFIVSDGVVSWTIFDCDGAIVEDCEYGLINQSCGDYESTLYNRIQVSNQSIEIYNCFEGPLPCGPNLSTCNLTNDEVLCQPFVVDTISAYDCFYNDPFSNGLTIVATSNLNGIDYIVVSNTIIVVSESVVQWTIFDCEGFVIEDCEYGMINQSCGDYTSTFYSMLISNGAGLDTIYNCLEDTSPCISITNNNIFEQGISVYPNPTTNLIQVEGLEGDVASYYLYNTNGLLVKEGKTNGSHIDISTYDNGFYILEVILNKQRRKILRFIKI